MSAVPPEPGSCSSHRASFWFLPRPWILDHPVHNPKHVVKMESRCAHALGDPPLAPPSSRPCACGASSEGGGTQDHRDHLTPENLEFAATVARFAQARGGPRPPPLPSPHPPRGWGGSVSPQNSTRSFKPHPHRGLERQRGEGCPAQQLVGSQPAVFFPGLRPPSPSFSTRGF